MDLTSALQALLLGVVEGATEFVPVSSTGHLILVIDLLGFAGTPGKSFEIVIQMGAILAVVAIYFRKLQGLAFGVFTDREAQLYVRNLVLAFLPALGIGATLYGPVTRTLFDPYVVCAALIAGGVAIILIERLRGASTTHRVEAITPRMALAIGFFQVLAMIPGTSRSGATIIGALLLGVARPTAAEFSFMLAIPTMFAATVYSLYREWSALTWDGAGLIAIGFASAFVVAFAVVRLVLAFIARIGFAPFGYYRIALGLLMLAILTTR
jgi:undecaprenyl-diphosphatase